MNAIAKEFRFESLMIFGLCFMGNSSIFLNNFFGCCSIYPQNLNYNFGPKNHIILFFSQYFGDGGSVRRRSAQTHNVND